MNSRFLSRPTLWMATLALDLMAALGFTAILCVTASAAFADAPEACSYDRATLCPEGVVVADVVALDQPLWYNRLGSSQPGGMIFALRRDVVALDDGEVAASLDPDGDVTQTTTCDGSLKPGCVRLRSDKRPRPLVLRVNEGQCLEVHFENLLAPIAFNGANLSDPADLCPGDGSLGTSGSVNERDFLSDAQFDGENAVCDTEGVTAVESRSVGLSVMGLSLAAACDADGGPVPAIRASGTFAGANPSAVMLPGESQTGVLFADQEGAYMMHSGVTNSGGGSFTGQANYGLFGAVHVEPRGSAWYRSQVTRDQMQQTYRTENCPDAQRDDGVCVTPLGQPLIDYTATDEEGVPILRMLDPDGHLVHGDLTAVVAHLGPDGQPGPFPERPDDPRCFPVPASPDRCVQPFREITAMYHDPFTVSQAFACAQDSDFDSGSYVSTCPTDWAPNGGDVTTPWLSDAVGAVPESAAINYGIAGIASEILANRFGVGPQGDCVGCKFEEFFLSSWPNGDPAMVSTLPTAAVTRNPNTDAINPNKTGQDLSSDLPSPVILYPDDPSNVYHSYIRDHVKFRIVHAGMDPHVHHQHAHQWLHTPNADSSHYLDSQSISQGSSFTLEMVYGGAGNRNETPGDAIFHCHFYPHFAQGMWSLWRIHDVLETGTPIDSATGLPAAAWSCTIDGQPASNADCLAARASDDSADHAAGDVEWTFLGPVRALPDGEIARGTPIPAVVPLPSRPMPPVPAPIRLDPDGRRAETLVASDDGDWQTLGQVWREQADDDVSLELARSVGNPGFPFFIPGVAGQRTVQPPNDFALLPKADGEEPSPIDGGLPRHIILPEGESTLPAGEVPFREAHTRLDFTKHLLNVDAMELHADGEPVEKLAMAWHGGLFEGGRMPSCTPEGLCLNQYFRYNGMPPQQGAPYADPCAPEDEWNGHTRRYQIAAIQTDVVFNKAGWHYPQQRLLSLWDDVEPTLNDERPPQPLFLRANSRECIDVWHANLVPNEFALDDFQVRTPTDILGQHIHLVKFDVTSSDGAANGYNYEDGTLSPDEVRERIAAINARGGLRVPEGTDVCADGSSPSADRRCLLKPEPHPYFGVGPRRAWIGAQTTVQRWIADPIRNLDGDDRTMRTIFTHDHFSPSTHQQAGLYAGILAEPECSQWIDPATGEVMGGSAHPLDPNRCSEPFAARGDGGPTSWQANIQWGEDDPAKEGILTGFREFALAFQNLALAYPADSLDYPDPIALQQSKESGGIGPTLNGTAPIDPTPNVVVAQGSIGTYTVNYRNEPLRMRVKDAQGAPPPARGLLPDALDYGHIFRSIDRQNDALNVQPEWYPPLTPGVLETDPYTPLLRTYAGDDVQIRTLVGGFFLQTNFSLFGLNWLAEPSLANSGYRSSQTMGLSEHFEMNFQIPRVLSGPTADFMYQTDSTSRGLEQGSWGILRAYADEQVGLVPLDSNPLPEADESYGSLGGRRQPGTCSPESLAGENGYTTRRYRVLALAAEDFAEGTLPHNRFTQLNTQNGLVDAPIEVPNGLVYVLEGDVEWQNGAWHFQDGRDFEPLILRAAAGDCIEVTLVNRFDPQATAFTTDNPSDQSVATTNGPQSPLESDGTVICTDANYRSLVESLAGDDSSDSQLKLAEFETLCAGSYRASVHVGLAAQLVAQDPRTSLGVNVGINPVQTAAPGEEVTYTWYAGKHDDREDGRRWVPVEFGSASLLPADPTHQHPKGLYGGLVIEPEGSQWIEDAQTRTTATVLQADGRSFREGVLVVTDDLEVYLRTGSEPTSYTPLTAWNIIGYSSSTSAVNYGSEPLYFRLPSDDLITLLNSQTEGTALTDSTLPNNGTSFPLPSEFYGTVNLDAADLSYTQSSLQLGRDPVSTVVPAHAGSALRLRLMRPSGAIYSPPFVVDGHGWPEQPYEPVEGAEGGVMGPGVVPQVIGPNPYSQRLGATVELSAQQAYDLVFEPTERGHNGAGGRFAVPGDYLYRGFVSFDEETGMWGLLRVGPKVPDDAKQDVIAFTALDNGDGTTTLNGSSSSILGSLPGEVRFADSVTLYAGGADGNGGCTGDAVTTLAIPDQSGPRRTWPSTTVELDVADDGSTPLCAVSSAGGWYETTVATSQCEEDS